MALTTKFGRQLLLTPLRPASPRLSCAGFNSLHLSVHRSRINDYFFSWAFVFLDFNRNGHLRVQNTTLLTSFVFSFRQSNYSHIWSHLQILWQTQSPFPPDFKLKFWILLGLLQARLTSFWWKTSSLCTSLRPCLKSAVGLDVRISLGAGKCLAPSKYLF